jgi:predicted DCC family thiol-disulfide oxidoreductase YuxK
MRRMHLVTPEGKVYAGFEAAVRAAATRPLLRLLAWVYYVPPVGFLLERWYALVAANRYRILGRAAEGCADGACSLHMPS